MSEKKKVLLVLNTINDYRVETYNIINEQFDLTVAYNVSDSTKNECNFKKYKIGTKKFGPFNIFGLEFWKLCKKYDAVITSFDIHNFEFSIIPFIKRKYKLLTWSIGFRCSYVHPYIVNRPHTILDRIAYNILQAADANIFYMEKAKEFWKSSKLDFNKIFIAPNTTSIAPSNLNCEKNSILFVGTLYRGKGVDKLILAFAEAVKDSKSNITLDVVGKGEQSEELKQLAINLGLSERIIFHGPIYDEKLLADKFAKAILCVSPTQAGLTVPKSMGYGVPMVTRRDAITGGEIYHITHGFNGILYDRDDELPEILKKAIIKPAALVEMSKNAKKYYNSCALPKHQAQGVIDALNYALKN